jgi:hypothetical protein
LNLQIAADCEPLVPFQQGVLRNSLRYPDGVAGGAIEWNTPYAHYIYSNILYKGSHPILDEEGNITGWWSEKKKTPTDRHLTYHEPGTTDHWFSKAKEKHEKEWIALVKEEMRKG